VPCLTIRNNTERPVTIDSGTNCLAGTSRGSILKAWRETRNSPKRGHTPPFWDGQAAIRSVAAIKQFLEAPNLVEA
jgi:UDP-N-acetylglucosamine 2-epimerase (non-hydrolysing)